MSEGMERPQWPYTIGLLGGAVFAIGALIMLYLVVKQTPVGEGTVKLAFAGLALGGALLGTCWIAVFKYGQGGFGTIAGSLVVPAAVLYLFTASRDYDSAFIGSLLVLGAFALFALGYVFIKQMAVRVFAAIALIALAIEFAATNRHWHLEQSTHELLGATALLGLALTAIATAFIMPSLQREDLSQPEL